MQENQGLMDQDRDLIEHLVPTVRRHNVTRVVLLPRDLKIRGQWFRERLLQPNNHLNINSWQHVQHLLLWQVVDRDQLSDLVLREKHYLRVKREKHYLRVKRERYYHKDREE